MYVYRERKPGWYEWSVSLSDDEPTFTWIIENDMGWKREGGGEYMGFLASDVNEHDWSDIEDMMKMVSDFMESQDN